MDLTMNQLKQKCIDFGVIGFPEDLSKDCSFCLNAENIKLPDRKLDKSDLDFLNSFCNRISISSIEELNNNPVPIRFHNKPFCQQLNDD